MRMWLYYYVLSCMHAAQLTCIVEKLPRLLSSWRANITEF